MMRKGSRRRRQITVAVVVMAFGVVGYLEVQARRNTRIWHREAPPSEVTEAELKGMQLAEYLKREDKVMRETRAIEDGIEEKDRNLWNRYSSGSASNPGKFCLDWNRTFMLHPKNLLGGALLVHGLSDSPYSMRPMAEVLRREGFYVLSLRLPGHGTVPAALNTVGWQDWLAAFRLGVKHVRSQIGPGKPLVLVGYSTGGALAVKYSADALKRRDLPRASRIILMSPMLGVSSWAVLTPLLDLVGKVGLESARWTEVEPEYNPFKYNSFPAHAGRQSLALTATLNDQLQEAAKTGLLKDLPPILTFQSLADSTVATQKVTSRLYDRLPANGSELVLFDLNQQRSLPWRSKPEMDELEEWRDVVFRKQPRRYTRSLVTNANDDSPEVVVRSITAGKCGVAVSRLEGVSWPRDFLSLSHVAVPFPPNDPLYGMAPDSRESYGVRLGALAPRAEWELFDLPLNALQRTSCNPFFTYMEKRVAQTLAGAGFQASPESGRVELQQ